jgi:hypothetical protein
MSGLTGIIAGFAVVAGAVALYRLAGGRLASLREAAKSGKAGETRAPVLDFEFDRTTGVFRSK